MEEENATMDKEADMNVDQELSLVYRKILHFIPSLLLPTDFKRIFSIYDGKVYSYKTGVA